MQSHYLSTVFSRINIDWSVCAFVWLARLVWWQVSVQSGGLYTIAITSPKLCKDRRKRGNQSAETVCARCKMCQSECLLADTFTCQLPPLPTALCLFQSGNFASEDVRCFSIVCPVYTAARMSTLREWDGTQSSRIKMSSYDTASLIHSEGSRASENVSHDSEGRGNDQIVSGGREIGNQFWCPIGEDAQFEPIGACEQSFCPVKK